MSPDEAPPAPDSLVREVEALISRGERAGHPLPAHPVVVLGQRNHAWSARGDQPARISIHPGMQQASLEERSCAISHELGHLLLGVDPPRGSLRARLPMSVGIVIAVASAVRLLLALVAGGPTMLEDSFPWLLGVGAGALVVVLGIMRRSREVESACDLLAAVVYGHPMTAETVARLEREEGLLGRLPTLITTHPKPSRRHRDVRRALARAAPA